MVSEPTAQLRTILREGEVLRWHAGPRAAPIYAQHGVVGLLLLFFFGPFLFFGLIFGFVIGEAAGNQALGPGMLILALGTGFLFLVGVPLSAKLRYDKAEYAATDERLIQFGGVVGRDYSTIKWENVRDVEANVGVIDRIFGTGSLQLTVAGVGGPTGGGGVKFAYVETPYEHLKTIENIMTEVEAAPKAD